MRNTFLVAMLLAIPMSGCGGEGDAVPGRPSPALPPRVALAPPPAEPVPPPSTPALIDLERRAVAAAVKAMNARDAGKYSELFAPDATICEYGVGEVQGREAIAGGIQKAFDGFPDFTVGVSRIFGKNDVLVQEWVLIGTNLGTFIRGRPTQKRIGVQVASVLSFTPEGLIQSEHRYFDTSTVLAQLGLMKAPVRPVVALPAGDPEWHLAHGTSEEDKQVELARAVFGAFERKSEPDFLARVSGNVSWSSLAQPKDMSAEQVFEMFTKEFPDAKFSSEAIFGVGDVVISESSMTATHASPPGSPNPTGKPITIHRLDIMVLKDGRVVSVASYSNSFELLGQEGLLPKREGAKAEADQKAGDPPAVEKQ